MPRFSTRELRLLHAGACLLRIITAASWTNAEAWLNASEQAWMFSDESAELLKSVMTKMYPQKQKGKGE